MVYQRVHKLFGLMLLVLATGQLSVTALGQPRRGGVAIPPQSSEPAKPRRGDAIIEREESSEPKVIVKRVKEMVRPNEGTLVVLAIPGSHVTVSPLLGRRISREDRHELTQNNNKLTKPALIPGKYRVQIVHPDYDRVDTTVIVIKGEPTVLLPTLISKYGTLVIGGAPLGTSVLLDGQALSPSSFKVDEAGRIIIARVPVGERALNLSRPGYDSWLKKVTISPGERTLEVAELKPATITLVLNTTPRAKVYFNGLEKAAVPEDGTLTISDLSEGDYRLSISLDTYETHSELLALSLAQRRVVKKIALMPIAASSEANADFGMGLRQWNPQPAGWRVETGSRHGLRIGGDGMALFRDSTERRNANVYFDFTLALDITLLNDRGAAWIIRAKDLKNYYLFELVTAKGSVQTSRLNFYICRDGALELKNGFPVPGKFDSPDYTHHLTVEARDNSFNVRLGSGDDKRSIGYFTDETFRYGGIGFRAVQGMEMLVQNLVIKPEKRGEQKPAK